MVVDEDGFLFEVFVFFGGAGEEERVGDGGVAFGYCGDDVGAAEPVGFRQVGEGPLGGVWARRPGVQAKSRVDKRPREESRECWSRGAIPVQ